MPGSFETPDWRTRSESIFSIKMWIEFLVVDDGRDSHPFVVFWIRLWLIHDRMPHRRRSMGDSCPRRSPWLQRTMQEPSLIQQTGHWASKEPLWIKNPQRQRRHCVQNYREHRTSGSPLEDPLARRDQMVRPNKNFRVPKERRNGITSFFFLLIVCTLKLDGHV